MQYDALTMACGAIMAARKMVKFLDKWPKELARMTQRGFKKQGKEHLLIKRCMLHIFEAYEEEFPSNRKETEKKPPLPLQSPLSSMNSMGSTDLLSSEKWFKSEIALPPRVETSNDSFECNEESGPEMISLP